MKEYFETYEITLKTRGPVYIGSGHEIKKKEYIYNERARKVFIPDLEKMYKDICKNDKQVSYENFLMNNDRKAELYKWLKDEAFTNADIEKWTSYILECGDFIREKGTTFQLMSFVKDAYNNPYIPGSSLKGMLRTVLLAYDIMSNADKYSNIKESIRENTFNASNTYNISKKYYLEREIREAEKLAFNTLKRTEKKNDMLNDVMAGIIIGDSEPLSENCLTLCQKIDRDKDGKERRFPVLRECIKPNTVIRFQMTIDRSLSKYTAEDIVHAIERFATQYCKNYSKKFETAELPYKTSVWIGGGAGFVTKTVMYPLFDKEGVNVVSRILDGKFRGHKHKKDIELGVSPHILKMTKYNGNYYQFGECIFKIKKTE